MTVIWCLETTGMIPNECQIRGNHTYVSKDKIIGKAYLSYTLPHSKELGSLYK